MNSWRCSWQTETSWKTCWRGWVWARIGPVRLQMTSFLFPHVTGRVNNVSPNHRQFCEQSFTLERNTSVGLNVDKLASLSFDFRSTRHTVAGRTTDFLVSDLPPIQQNFTCTRCGEKIWRANTRRCLTMKLWIWVVSVLCPSSGGSVSQSQLQTESWAWPVVWD